MTWANACRAVQFGVSGTRTVRSGAVATIVIKRSQAFSMACCRSLRCCVPIMGALHPRPALPHVPGHEYSGAGVVVSCFTPVPEYSQGVAASRRDTDVPTTSYAVLGMLALRPWSAYELNKQLRRDLAYCWPKTQSVLYDEPKRLAVLGWARSRREHTGRRTRTVYEITPAGREALREWLATEPAAPRFEIETMLRLLFADQGSKDDVLTAVR